MNSTIERTFVLIKPEGVQRKMVGKIISRFEEVGLELEAVKLVRASKELMERHYPSDDDWLRTVGGKTRNAYAEYGLDPTKEFGTDDALAIGREIKRWLVDYMTSGPVVAMILKGNRAVRGVRKLAGNTVPLFAEPGTIRGDFSTDSPDLANPERRPVYNLVHASGTVEEAEFEIALWFADEA
jgi:nucleoside-diphosphate kinase